MNGIVRVAEFSFSMIIVNTLLSKFYKNKVRRVEGENKYILISLPGKHQPPIYEYYYWSLILKSRTAKEKTRSEMAVLLKVEIQHLHNLIVFTLEEIEGVFNRSQ